VAADRTLLRVDGLACSIFVFREFGRCPTADEGGFCAEDAMDAVRHALTLNPREMLPLFTQLNHSGNLQAGSQESRLGGLAACLHRSTWSKVRHRQSGVTLAIEIQLSFCLGCPVQIIWP